MTRLITAALLTLCLEGCRHAGTPAAFPNPATDRDQVLAVERDVALVLARDGFDAYAALFHPEYTNWPGGDSVVDRAPYLERVKRWYDAGNRALTTEIRPITIEIFGDLALSRYFLREEFSDGTAFVGRFASVARWHEGRWLLYRTSFSTIYRGAKEGAPRLVP